jgi:hypothetical protein
VLPKAGEATFRHAALQPPAIAAAHDDLVVFARQTH